MDAWFYINIEPFVKPEQVIIYQPHCPELPWQEIDTATPENAKYHARLKGATERLFGRANHLVFPNAGAAGIYESLIHANQQVHYLLSGAAKPAGISAVPLDPAHCYFLYIGRRLAIKGFDLVLEAFQAAQRIRPEIRLIICGQGEKIISPGVIDVGYTRRIHDWMASADCIVNGNRQSYFDLSVMEGLAVGTPVALTTTEGHVAFRELASEGILPLGPASSEALMQLFLTFQKEKGRSQTVRGENRALYERHFSVSEYHHRLTRFTDRVLSA